MALSKSDGKRLAGVRTIRRNVVFEFRAYFNDASPSVLCDLEEGDQFFDGDELFVYRQGSYVALKKMVPQVQKILPKPDIYIRKGRRSKK